MPLTALPGLLSEAHHRAYRANPHALNYPRHLVGPGAARPDGGGPGAPRQLLHPPLCRGRSLEPYMNTISASAPPVRIRPLQAIADDTLRFLETDMRDGFLHVRQGKTAQKLRIEITGELAAVIGRIMARKARYRAEYRVVSLYLVVNESGLPLTAGALRDRFDKAREAAGVPKSAFQFRDLRAKAGTDKTEAAGDIRQAQKQLGHGSVTTTEKYVRRRKGDKAAPTR
ncbi:hypothetical protein CE205_00450 [Achromobacter insolitus]|nr:hypothetical protein CE205_00450 [Achromobacter insolitus]